MSRSEIERGVRAGLEAAAQECANTELEFYPNEIINEAGLYERAVRDLDPAAIAATVESSTDVPLDVHVRLLEEVTALRQRISARNSGCACTINEEGTEVLGWCQIHASLRQRVAELEHALDAEQAHVEMLEARHTMALMQGLRISGHEHGTAEIHLYDDQIFNDCLLENVDVLVFQCAAGAVNHCSFVGCTITLDPTGPGRAAFRYCHFDEATTFSEPQPKGENP